MKVHAGIKENLKLHNAIFFGSARMDNLLQAHTSRAFRPATDFPNSRNRNKRGCEERSPEMIGFQEKSPVLFRAWRHRHGAQGRDRTTDTAIFSRMLYQLSYLGPPRR